VRHLREGELEVNSRSTRYRWAEVYLEVKGVGLNDARHGDRLLHKDIWTAEQLTGDLKIHERNRAIHASGISQCLRRGYLNVTTKYRLLDKFRSCRS
jgi:hypothetical protein